MKYYNLVLPFGESIEDFLRFCDETKNNLIIPRIPENRLSDENQDEERICLGTSFENCLTSIGSNRLNQVFEKYYKDESTGIPILIREFKDLDEYWLIKPDKEDVLDVEITDEHWYLMPIKPSKVYVKWLLFYRDGQYCDTIYKDWAIKMCDEGEITEEELVSSSFS